MQVHVYTQQMPVRTNRKLKLRGPLERLSLVG